MGKGFRHGSEAMSYGFKIIGGTTRPNNPTQGMVWANTPNEVTHIYLSDVKPNNPTDGTLWVRIGDSGNIKIVSPVSKEWITVYPLSAEQYVSGAWKDIEAISYQDGKWVEWWNGELFDNGDEIEWLTGGWVLVKEGSNGSMVNDGDELIITGGGANNGVCAITKNTIDLTYFDTIHFNVSTRTYSSTNNHADISVGNAGKSNWTQIYNNAATTYMGNGVAGEGTVDVSSLTGEYYVSFRYYGAGATNFGCNKIWME